MAEKLFQFYLIPIVIAAFFIWRYLRFRRARQALPLLLSKGAVVVDVRTRKEYASGSNSKSINIPLDELDLGSSRLDPNKPVVVCCASGTRSATAAARLRRKGFTNVINVGSWKNTVV